MSLLLQKQPSLRWNKPSKNKTKQIKKNSGKKVIKSLLKKTISHERHTRSTLPYYYYVTAQCFHYNLSVWCEGRGKVAGWVRGGTSCNVVTRTSSTWRRRPMKCTWRRLVDTSSPSVRPPRSASQLAKWTTVSAPVAQRASPHTHMGLVITRYWIRLPVRKLANVASEPFGIGER